MTVTTSSPERRTRWRPARLALYALVLVPVVAVVVLAYSIMRPVDYVDEVTVENPYAWNANVEVGDGDRWLGMGVAPAGDSATFNSVIDQGDVWAFRFSYGGVEAPPVHLDRMELEESDWTVTVPESFDEAMRSADIPSTAG